MMIKLETPDQEQACDYINQLYDQARGGSTSSLNTIKTIYQDDWKTIKQRMECEGSIWYVWYMDGVNKFLEWQRVRGKKI